MKRLFLKLRPLFFASLLLGAVVVLPRVVFAETLPETGMSEFAAQAGFGGTEDIRVIIARLIRTVLAFAGIVLVGMIIYGGIRWMLSGGAADKLKTARGIIVNAIIGLVIVLSAFAITQFVVSSLVSATGSSSVSDSSGGGPGIPGCPTCPVDTDDSFVVESWGCLEALSKLPKNVEIQILFNRTLPTAASDLESAVKVSAGNTSVDVALVASGETLLISALDNTCDSEAGSFFCEGTEYTVTVQEGFTSADGVPVDCRLDAPCSYTFSTTGIVDATGPTVSITAPPNSSSVFSFIPLTLQADVSDDSGVGVTDFTVNSLLVDSAEPSACEGEGPMSCLANGLWSPGNLTPGSSHVIRATASDCSGNAATSAPVTVTAFEAHCANSVQDDDETGVDCGGSDCAACEGDSCSVASDCSSFLCVDGECVTGPKITGINLGNGAPGNFITITGSGFGSAVGAVTFLGAPGNDADNTAASVVSCPAPSWSNTQIVVTVPTGAVTGALQVTTSAGLVDATDDGFGPIAPDFVVNTTVRPGLCAVAPSVGEAGDRIAISGVHFGTDASVGDVYFQGTNVYEATFLPALDTWSENLVSVLVPPSVAGSYNLSVFVGSEGSNPLAFQVGSTTAAATAPRIDYVDSGVQLCVGDVATEGLLCATDVTCGTGTCEPATTTGGAGQYVTIFGDNFGSALGTVLFSDADRGDITFVPDFPAQCSTAWWSDTAIVVQVPEGFSTLASFNPKTIRVRAAGYPTVAESNRADFTIADIGVTPGVCSVTPTAGPAGTAVTLSGDNFGASASDFEVRFYNGSTLPPSVSAAASSDTFVSEQEIGTTVPTGAFTGPLAVVAGSLSSNTLDFQVGDCNTVENLCSSSQVCCPSGACAATVAACSGLPVDAQYVYTFTTGPVPSLPSVIEACNTTALPSPAPSTLWPDGQLACLEAVVTAAFAPGAPSTGMNQATLEDPSNVFVDRCIGSGLDPCEATEVNTAGDPVHVAGSLSATPLTVTFTPTIPPSATVALLPNTWYRVTLTSGITNAAGVALPSDYTFRFKTRTDTTPCEVEGAVVSPADYTATSSAPITYEALPTTSGCQALNPDNYAYDWTLDNHGQAIVFVGNVTSVTGTDNDIVVLPNEETNPGQPAIVSAGVVGFAVSGSADLTVDYLDPYVTSAIPQCATACVNAQVGATFNVGMEAEGEAGILGAHTTSAGTEANVRLFACTDEFCNAFAGPALSAPLVFVNDSADPDDGRTFFWNGTLTPSTYYRALIWGGVESEPGPGQPSGVALSPASLNYGAYYSWTFRTRADSAACGIGSAEVNPAQVLLHAIGERAGFSATPLGVPDSCSLNGQPLNPLSYPWNWILSAINNPLTSLPVQIASFLPDHTPTATLNTSSESLATCTASCLNAGSVAYEAICGNGIVEQDANDAWEDCDPTAPGWSAVECTTTCQVVGISACTATVTSGCCGNGVPEGREECDDGGNQNGNGCSAACLNEGALAAGLTCGDGVVTHSNTLLPIPGKAGGEECDDDNTVSGDGCSSVCLREGSVSVADVNGVCGNSAIEEGEDCDDGDGDSGDGCSSVCLQEPLGPGAWSIGSLSGVCGNSALEPVLSTTAGVGEECDDGNAVNGDGCSAACLNEGASVFYDTPTFCGDGVPTWSAGSGGEECDAATLDGVPAYDPVQYVEIEPVAAQTVVNGLAATILSATGNDTATSTSASDTAVIGLDCSCETDTDCGNTTALGCGVNGCCFERPEVDPIHTYPLTTTTNALCRNTLAQVRFSEAMNPEGLFTGNDNPDPLVFLELVATDDNLDGQYTLSADGPLGDVICPSSYVTYDFGAKNRFTRFLRSLVRLVRPTAFAATVGCVAPANLIPTTMDIGTPSAPNLVTDVSIQYTQALEPNAIYRLVVVGDSRLDDALVEGVTSAWNVTMNGSSGPNSGPAGGWAATWSNLFVTSAEVCTVSQVVVTDASTSPGLLTESGESHPLSASAYSKNGPVLEPIIELPGIYDWSWAGVDGSLVWGWSSSLPAGPTDVISVASVGETDVEATATVATVTPAINGEETIQAQLRIGTADSSIDTPGRIVSGSIVETVFLCENPWPGVANFPFADSAEFDASNTLGINLSSPFTNFSFQYCRDAGNPADTSDDLPALSVLEKTSGIETPGVFKEFLFTVDDPDSNDAIGVRVLSNPNYLSPAAWFADAGFVGSPSPATLDGFEAVQDGRTAYATAPNIAGTPGNPTRIYPNVYVIAYNEGASEETRTIASRLFAEWSFVANTNPITGSAIVTNNKVCAVTLPDGSVDPVEVEGQVVACSSDAECLTVPAPVLVGGPVPTVFCDAKKDKLRRDFRRLSDLRQIGAELEDYGNTHGHCSVTKNQACFTSDDCSGTEICVASVPTLAEGTFIPSMSSSAWPSWQAQLGNVLGSAVPVDPLNAYSTCPAGYDPASCYDALNALAVCPDDSYVYTYRSIGGESYWLEADLEYGNDVTSFPWANPVDTFELGELFIGNAVQNPAFVADPATDPDGNGGFDTAPNCQSTVTFSATNICGDGNVGGGEICEVGDTSTISCSVSVCENTTDLSYNGDVCTSPSQCGPGGACVPTTGVKTVACYAPGDNGGPGCNGYQLDSESTAACLPYFCGDGIVDCGPDDICNNADDVEECDDGPLNGQYGYCGLDCTESSGAFCGDGLLAGTEACDCGANASYHLLSVPNQTACTTPASTPLLNGAYYADETYGCSASCDGPEAYCGDGVVTSGEDCDGQVEQWDGKLCSDGTVCTTNADCSSGVCGGPVSWQAECPDSSSGFPQTRTRSCSGVVSPVANSCQWLTGASGIPGGWGGCEPMGSCGNGVVEGTETCDDGNTSNQDACTNSCALNTCGDGYRNIGVEACDLGGQNGVACTAPYGGNCSYCSTTCNFLTVTGGYCGDNTINGGEYCDGSAIPSRCYKGDNDPALRDIGDVCGTGYPACPTGYVCEALVGLCDGGSSGSVSFNGDPCVAGSNTASRSCASSAHGSTLGECVAQNCGNACGEACPFTLEQGPVLVQAEGSSSRQPSVDLYSYLSGPSPDEATLFFPACTVGSQLLGDVDFSNIVSPQVDVLFLVDLSNSMSDAIDGDPPDADEPSRISIVTSGLLVAVDELYDAFPSGDLEVALAGFASGQLGSPINSDGTASTLQTFTSSKTTMLTAISTELTPTGNTPTADGLDWAYGLMQARVGNGREHIVVLLTDGEPNSPLHSPNFTGNSAADPVWYMADAYFVSQDLQDELDVEVYTAAFTSSNSRIAKSDHLSSNTCGQDYDNLGDCSIPTSGTDYAYDAETESEFTAMMSDIVDNILGLNVSYVTSTGPTSGAVQEGNDVVLPFPPGFSCEEVADVPQAFDIDLFVNFNSGDPNVSRVNLSNLRLEYCPFQ